MKLLRKPLAFMLVMVLCMAQVIPAYAVDAISNGVEATFDEAYYATMDYYGNLKEGSVVKSYIMNGQTSILDYGQYDEVINLTDSTKPDAKDASVKFEFDKKVPDHFYFEGKTAAPFYQLPWSTEIHYRLNGVMTEAEKLAGEKGMVDILLDFIPNEAASEYAKNNYVMAATAVFNQDDILSLEAEGAQVQLVGNLRLVLFMVMPGEEQHFKISVGTDSFEFGGMTFLLMPATLAQLQEISKISDKKDDIEKNYHRLNDSLNDLIDSLDGVSGSLRDAADGIDEIDEGRQIISDNKDEVYDGFDEALLSLDDLDTAIQKMPGHLDAFEKITEQTHKVLGSMDDTLEETQKALRKMSQHMNSLESSFNALSNSSSGVGGATRKLAKQTEQLKQDYQNLLPLMAELQLQIGGDQINFNPEGAGTITLGGVSSMLSSATPGALKTLNKLRVAYASATSGGATEMDLAIFMVTAQVAGGASKAAAMANYGTYAASKSAIMAGVNAATGGSTDPDVIMAAIPTVMAMGGATTEQIEGFVTLFSLEQIYGKFAAKQGNHSTMNENEFVAAMIYASSVTPGMDAMTKAKVEAGAMQQASMSKLGEMNNNLADCIDMLGTGSSAVGGKVATLMDQVGVTMDNLYGVTAQANKILQQADDLLDDVDDLLEVENTNYKDIKGLVTDTKDAITALSGTIKTTHKSLDTLQGTMKSAGSKFDSGSKKALEGIAQSLRSAANSLDKVNRVKTAKNSINDIVVDLWNDYTGDVNRLLLMDANAPARSLTDDRNANPTSIQVLMRSQEIKIDEEAIEDIVIPENHTTFWGRITQMLSDIWAAITGIFK